MPGDLSIGGGVYIYIPSAIDYWPVTGVTQPQHYWPFSETGDYTDQGSEGDLDMEAVGTGNSFNNGLVLNGSGNAGCAVDADVSDIGATWSLIVEGSWSNAGNSALLGGIEEETGLQGWNVMSGWSGTSMDMRTYKDGNIANYDQLTLFTPGTNYQLIVTYSGGNATLYVDGSLIKGPGALAAPGARIVRGIAVGAYSYYGSYKVTGTIKRAGVLKGEAWSADDVAAIYAALP